MARTRSSISPEIRAEVAALTAAILAGKPRPRPSRAKPDGGRGQARPRESVYSYKQMAVLREQGLTITGIAAAMGCHRSTVISGLTALGVYEPDVSGRPPGEKCPKGLHLMSEHGRPVKGGGRYCVPCKATRALDRRAEKADAHGHASR